jgi:DNA-binding transcriptional regulator YhcF (GntR family)
MSSNTTKKTQIVGTETYMNHATGEIEEFNVIRIEDADFNFDKFWVSQLLTAIDEFGSQKIKLLMYLIQHRERSNNAILKTIRELAAETGISKDTISATLKILEAHGIVKRKTGVIFISPNVVFRGSHSNRRRILIEYSKAESNVVNIDREANEPPAAAAAQSAEKKAA